MSADQVKEFFTRCLQTVESACKVTFRSRKASVLPADSHRDMLILGNGPSLKKMIAEKGDFMADKALMVVNFAALSDEYASLQPHYYVLADPVFFTDQARCGKLFDALVEKTAWDLALCVSADARRESWWQQKIAANPRIRVYYFNMTPVEGFSWFTHTAYAKGWGTPRPRNVLIPSIMLALRMPFDTIYLGGADHSWLKEISVDDHNVVIQSLQHFYDKNGDERYVSSFHLHHLLQSMYIAFKAYHTIQEYALSAGKKIVNVTEGSYIDAFPRQKI